MMRHFFYRCRRPSLVQRRSWIISTFTVLLILLASVVSLGPANRARAIQPTVSLTSTHPTLADQPLSPTQPRIPSPHASTKGPARLHYKQKFFPLLPHASYPETSVVFVHGLNAGDGIFGTATNGNATMGDCRAYWNDAHGFLASRWPGDFRQVSYYQHELNIDGSACADNGNESVAATHYSADLHDALYTNRCTSFNSAHAGTNNESLDHISCLLAWYLFFNFGQHNWQEILVGHSMGGLIIRRTLEMVQQHAPFMPGTIGTVTDALTFDTPHSGVFGASLVCGNCLEGQEMNNNSAFIRDLALNAQHPTTGNTDWTVIGSSCDYLVGNSALNMSANHKVWYERGGNSTCYDHGGAIHDLSTILDGQASYCDAPNPTGSDCIYQENRAQGSNWYYDDTYYPHGLLDLFYGLESSWW